MLIGDVWISPPMVGELTEQLGVHATTVRRWLKKATIPKASYLLLELFQNGSIARIHDAWSGWVIAPQDRSPDRAGRIQNLGS